mmetsp:Transcript_34618/g.98092  ORF Transcript_34618/g.98092 Transcript_34618/m.98092 type:complete len:218 (-) Transcript_34618:266-919(-)
MRMFTVSSSWSASSGTTSTWRTARPPRRPSQTASTGCSETLAVCSSMPLTADTCCTSSWQPSSPKAAEALLDCLVKCISESSRGSRFSLHLSSQDCQAIASSAEQPQFGDAKALPQATFSTLRAAVAARPYGIVEEAEGLSPAGTPRADSDLLQQGLGIARARMQESRFVIVMTESQELQAAAAPYQSIFCLPVKACLDLMKDIHRHRTRWGYVSIA